MTKIDGSLIARRALAEDYAKRTGMPHKSGNGARIAYEPDIANAMLAFFEEAAHPQPVALDVEACVKEMEALALAGRKWYVADMLLACINTVRRHAEHAPKPESVNAEMRALKRINELSDEYLKNHKGLTEHGDILFRIWTISEATVTRAESIAPYTQKEIAMAEDALGLPATMEDAPARKDGGLETPRASSANPLGNTATITRAWKPSDDPALQTSAAALSEMAVSRITNGLGDRVSTMSAPSCGQQASDAREHLIPQCAHGYVDTSKCPQCLELEARLPKGPVRKCMICGYGRYCNNCLAHGDNHKAMFTAKEPGDVNDKSVVSMHQPADKQGFSSEIPVIQDTPVAYMRDRDGTGSLHVCADGDPGSFPVYAQPCAFHEDEASGFAVELTEQGDYWMKYDDGSPKGCAIRLPEIFADEIMRLIKVDWCVRRNCIDVTRAAATTGGNHG